MTSSSSPAAARVPSPASPALQRLLEALKGTVLGQLGSISIAIVWCLVFVKISWDGTMTASVDGNVQMMASKPDAGVFIAIGSGLISLAGTLAGLKDQRL